MFGSGRPALDPAGGTAVAGNVCLQCGVPAARAGTTTCRRCGLPFGAQPRAEGALASCPVCYQTTGDDGLLPSLDHGGRRVDLVHHIGEHEHHPVGDDEWLESLRRGDRIRIERWEAPFDLVRRYLVTGVVDAGRSRAARHDTIVTAMAQLARWGPAGVPAIGDEPSWREARAAVTALMERYHHRRF
jgi:hypothetical protein